MDVTLLYFEGCPNWKNADEGLSALAEELGWQVERVKVETAEQAEEVGFRGSPTILVRGGDPFAKGDEPVGLSCRIYQTPDGPAGAPTEEQLRRVLL
ncbi:MAG: thioredoxin family protein [Actinomycetota bacterium]|nr:thioredoxin family protein [Actinomycetota bacterium]